MKKTFLWILAVIITLSAAMYQRKTGPTYPRAEKVILGDSTYSLELIRTSGARDARVKLPVKDTAVHASVYYKKLGIAEDWTRVDFKMTNIKYHSAFMKKIMRKKDETTLAAYLPQQPSAGKLEYYIELVKNGQTVDVAKNRPVVIRFKGDVPAGVLIPHILLMFLAMLFSTIAGLFAAFKIERFRRYTLWTFVILFIGGFILGPWVQWYAFGDWWTGIPFGWDLTDNKTLFAFVFWAAALFGIKGKGRPWLIILAALMTLVIFSIPHSLFGSTLNYTTGSVTQG
ncbi:MAG: hypothetical protein D4R64_01570 [Porphyromonadaceae bacterium]|nr:MAG: hypothetical protein D4R64_01570 [Porphyromonadaceae bacterium]